jgi:hypothetical protein
MCVAWTSTLAYYKYHKGAQDNDKHPSLHKFQIKIEICDIDKDSSLIQILDKISSVLRGHTLYINTNI